MLRRVSDRAVVYGSRSSRHGPSLTWGSQERVPLCNTGLARVLLLDGFIIRLVRLFLCGISPRWQ